MASDTKSAADDMFITGASPSENAGAEHTAASINTAAAYDIILFKHLFFSIFFTPL